MPVRFRATVRANGDRAAELRLAARLRRDLWAHTPVEVDPDHPLQGTHRDEQGHAYFELATEFPELVRQLVSDHQYTQYVELTESPASPGEECVNCGNVAGPMVPAVCPNCNFEDISRCPLCRTASSRQAYVPDGGDLFRCPHCRQRVRLRFNSPMFLANGNYNQPLVLVEEATVAHEIR